MDKLSFAFEADTETNKFVLDNINLEINKGEFVVILGRNGSGKSTFAKHLNALYLPTGGKVYIDGLDSADITEAWNIRRKAGMVFQNPDNQLVATIVEEDVAFGPENLGLPPVEIRQRVDEALRIVGMEDYSQHASHLLSGGQKQRVAIAGVIAMKPDYMILDEPTAMLDPEGRKEVLETVKKLNKEEGLTIILITHWLDEAVDADRVIVMEEGKITLEGTPREIFQQIKTLKKLSLDVPQMTELAYLLRKEGIDLPKDILTVNEMVRHLCQLKLKT